MSPSRKLPTFQYFYQEKIEARTNKGSRPFSKAERNDFGAVPVSRSWPVHRMPREILEVGLYDAIWEDGA
jgi:hypothetical protein